MGFSITACVMTGTMFICYCIALGEFSSVNQINSCYYYKSYDYYDYYSTKKKCILKSTGYNLSVGKGLGLGSLQLIYSIGLFVVALASSVYCCKAMCCGASAVGTVSNMILILFTLLVLITVLN